MAKYLKEQDEKHGHAEQQRLKALSDRVVTAKKESSKLDKALQTREEIEKEKEEKLQKEMKHEDEAKQHALQLQQQHALKARQHNMKVIMTVEEHKEKRAMELQAMKADSDAKMQMAEEKREQELKKIIDTAIKVGQKHPSAPEDKAQ